MTRSSGNPGVAAGQLASEVGHPPPTPTGDVMADTQEFARLGLEVDPSAAMSADSGFRVGWRGYDRGQVDRYRSRVETDLANTRIGYQRAIHAHERLSEQLRARETDLARVRGQFTDSPSALSERLREILHLAAQDAEETRAAAQAEARQTGVEAQADADQLRADAETVLKQAQETAAAIVGRAHAEQQTGRAELEQEQATVRQQLAEASVEAERARQRAGAEAAARRHEADQQAQERREQAEVAATARLHERSEQLAELTRQRDEVIASLSSLRDKLANVLHPPTDTEAPAASSS